MNQTDKRDTSFADLGTALEGVDRDRLTIVPLFAGDDAGLTAHLVVWPPNAPSQACVHEDFAEAAHIVAGSIIDEDGTEHRAGGLWMRPAHHVHHPRAGAEGAQLVLWRAPVPA
ncbi:hypothetical protein [Streptomyces sp. 11x1]|uniref:hypothetical protein n=1 Tax=Streptomyces sp. 11x1 TaxID=3038642 RepID=UPI00292F5F33|nr:hypothetical protein [Streptomyces sp. 11x1]WNZ09521.1 hypothetical protein P8T65_19310 [Streptomyces sp. 11x1]